jgi:Nif-specific regulatory protein
MRALLTIEQGQGDPRVCPLEQDRPVTLGRHRKNCIVLHDEHASRWHAEVFAADGRWFIRDNGTLNGTRLDGDAINEPVALVHDQVISIGRTSLRFSLEEAEAEQTTDPEVALDPAKDSSYGVLEIDQTILCRDELTVLCNFMSTSVKETDDRAFIQKALETIHATIGASVTGFLSLDRDDPLPKIVIPKQARVDVPLSRKLTQAVQRLGRAVWLGAQPELAPDSESLVCYTDALCLPLRVGETPVGAIHAYRSNRVFTERDTRFCEVLVGHLANGLHVLRVQRALQAENSRLRSHLPGAEELIGSSPALQSLRQRIGRLASGRSLVLIVGESGVGKELVALALHRMSPRRDGPLVSVNCAAIAPTLLESELFGHCRGAFSGAERDRSGLFQQADEGTLFLDEVGELSLECQAKLLRVIEGKGFRLVGGDTEIQVNVRIIAATHRNLAHEVEEGGFRGDLYYRLQGIQIAVPPLREHIEDVPELVGYFLERLSVEWGRPFQITPEAVRRLQEYSWPGNVRQLRSVLENAVGSVDHDTIDTCHLAFSAAPGADVPLSLNLEELEAWAIRQALRRTEGNITHAARLLGIARDTLGIKIKKYQIRKDELAAG